MILRRLFPKRFSSLTNPSDTLRYAFGGTSTVAGEDVSPTSAMGLSAYYAGLRVISEDTAKLPLKTYKRQEPRGREEATEHRNYRLLHDEPNPIMGSMTFRELVTNWAMGWGGGYAEIVRNGRGEGKQLWPVHPSRMKIEVSEQDGQTTLVYVIETDNGPRKLPAYAVFHLHGIGDDGITGYSVAQVGCESIGRALAAQKFSGAFFGNRAQFGVVVEHPGKMEDKAYQNLKNSISTEYGGDRKFSSFVLEDGVKLVDTKNLGIPPEEAQLIETMQFTVEDIARWFRVSPSKLQHFLRAQGWSTLEMLNTDHVTDALMPWIVRWEQEIKRKLFFPQERKQYYAEHSVNALLRGDSAARSAFYKSQLETGALSPNEIRELENHNPVPDGDAYFISNNVKPVEQALKPPTPPPMLPPPGGDDEPDKPDEPEEKPDDNEEAKQAAKAAVSEAFGRVLRKEIKAVRQHVKQRLERGDVDRFTQWLETFYGRHEPEMVELLGPSLDVTLVLQGQDDRPQIVGGLCSRHVTSHKAQLLAVLRDSGNDPQAVLARLGEWETNSHFEDVSDDDKT